MAELRVGPVTESPGDTWNTISYAVLKGIRGLTGSSTLARLLERERKPPETLKTFHHFANQKSWLGPMPTTPAIANGQTPRRPNPRSTGRDLVGGECGPSVRKARIARRHHPGAFACRPCRE